MELARQVRPRRNAPVFVVGCARSGTTLLYDTLLSAGDFALYLGESNIFNLLAPRFGNLAVRKNREKMFEVWLGSGLFRVSGLERSQIEDKILEDCRNSGDFLCIVMDEIARQQGVRRWAGNAPEEVLYLREIKKTIPEALVIHMIRDGRDVSVSLSEKRYIRPFPWKKRETPEGAAFYWEWIVRNGRAAGAELGNDYTEVRFEELVREPHAVLRRLSQFLDHDLEYDHIRKNAVGVVARPNTSFKGTAPQDFNPVGRWKRQLAARQVERIERFVGGTLAELGYSLTTAGGPARNSFSLTLNRVAYRRFFKLKLQWKKNSILRALRPSFTSRDVDEVVVVDERAAKGLRRTEQSGLAGTPGIGAIARQ